MPTKPTISRRKPLLATAAALAAATAVSFGLAASPVSAVVNGSPAAANSNPWQVALLEGGEHICGGSVVSPTVVVTAAHCTQDVGSLQVLAGARALNSTEGQTRQVVNITVHPNYRGEGSDIAKLTLAQPLQLGGAVQAIELASSADIANATEARVSGWGSTSENDQAGSQQLLEATVPLVDDDTCNRQLGGIEALTETCAGGTGTDSCYGDSGGPLVVTGTDGAPKLAGVVSWGSECGGDTPGVYAEVPTFADWINGADDSATSGATETTDATQPAEPTESGADFTDEYSPDAGFDDEYLDDADKDDGVWDDADLDDADFYDSDFDDSYWDDAEFDESYWDDPDFDDTDFDEDYWDDTDWDHGAWDELEPCEEF